MPKILFLTLHRKNRSPGQRFRHEQYLDFLEKNGFEVTYSNMLNQQQDKIFYSKGNILKKILVGFSAMQKRLNDLSIANRYDYIFIYRDAFVFGTFFEWAFKKSKAKLILDFDDSIWLHDKNSNHLSIFQKLKNPTKTKKIISYCDLTIVGNKYLAEYAKQYTSNVTIIPTTIDLNKYTRVKITKDEKICIGWSGSFSTVKHFESVLEPLKRIKERYSKKVYFKVIGDSHYVNSTLDIQGLPWKKDTEIADLCEIDIGIMPLPDDLWSRGKCGLKGLQYMALEIPTIMSPVGINSDIIQDEENGFLATTTEEWVEKLSLLIEDEALRKKLGENGKKIVEQDYSVEANKEKWLTALSF